MLARVSLTDALLLSLCSLVQKASGPKQNVVQSESVATYFIRSAGVKYLKVDNLVAFG